MRVRPGGVPVPVEPTEWLSQRTVGAMNMLLNCGLSICFVAAKINIMIRGGKAQEMYPCGRKKKTSRSVCARHRDLEKISCH